MSTRGAAHLFDASKPRKRRLGFLESKLPAVLTICALTLALYSMGYEQGSEAQCSELREFLRKSDLVEGSYLLLIPEEADYSKDSDAAISYAMENAPHGSRFWGFIPIGVRTVAVYAGAPE